MKVKFSKEIIIGIVTIISLVALYLGVNFLKGVNVFQPVNHYYVACSNVRDVNISSPVFIDGFKVGLVRDIIYDYSASNPILVEISLEKSMKLTKGTYITLEKTFLSGSELHLHLNNYVDEYLKPGATIEGRMKGDMVGMVESNVLPQLVGMMPKIDSILTSLNALVGNPALSQSLTRIDNITANLELSSRQLNQLLGKDVPVIATNLKSATLNFVEASDEMKTELKDLNLAESVQSLNATLGSIQLTMEKLQSKDNSMGLLLNDTLLYKNLNQTVENASLLLIDLKQNPKRYVRFSLF
jgi:phospholipid/cholesterol/gamma-HCH transport system substrate-binding protein